MQHSSQLRKRADSSQQSISYKAPKGVRTVDNARHKMARTTSARNAPVPTPRNTQRAQQQQPSRMPAPTRHRRFPTSFCSTLRRSPPSIPPSLLRFVSNLDHDKNWPGSQAAKKKDNIGPGRVKVLLRVCPESVLSRKKSVVVGKTQSPSKIGSILRVEGNRKHVSIFDSESGLQSAQMRVGVSAPKLYAFDAVFPEDAPQAEVCSTSLLDVLQAVVQGADGAVFSYGHSGLGKTYTLIGSDVDEHELGVIPCAISWLYRTIDEMKEKTKGRFSVRVSAIEVHGRTEELKDLLKDQAKGVVGILGGFVNHVCDNKGCISDSLTWPPSGIFGIMRTGGRKSQYLIDFCPFSRLPAKDDAPGEDICVREDPLFGTQLQNQCELRASSVEKAAHLLDAALAARSSYGSRSVEEARRHSHMVYTLHIYQYKLDKSEKPGVTGGRSRLHFIDLGSCERTLVKTPNSLTLSLNSLGHVIMAIINNSKHVPFKESKLTLVLQDLLGNFNCRTVMLAHVAKGSKHYADTLSTVQMASRIHRVLLKKKVKTSSGAGSVRGVGCHISKSMRTHKARGTDEESLGTSSGVGETSGSEVSCDTVIYVRPNGLPYSDRELTDNEGPPTSIPIRTPPQSKKSLSKICENNQSFEGRAVIDVPPEKEVVSMKQRSERPPSRLPGPQTNSQRPRIASNTQQKLASHAKLIGNIRSGEQRGSRIPKSSERSQNRDRKFETTAAYKRNNSKIPSRRRTETKSKIPPPPPPRLPTTRLRHSSSESVRADEVRNLAVRDDSQTSHQPTYETLHSSHNSPHMEQRSSNHGSVRAPEDGLWAEQGAEVHGELENESEYAHDVEKHQESSGAWGYANRVEPEGSDVPTQSRKLGRTAVTNLSYSTVTVDAFANAKNDISRCLQDFNEVLSVAEENGSLSDAISMASHQDNGYNNEWNSDDDDTFTSDTNDVSEGDDVVGVNFYCLSFTTKNPLIPLSKRSFVQQVSRNKRMSLEGRSSCSSSASDTSRNHASTRVEKVNNTHPSEMESESRDIQCEEPSVGKLRRSNTFDTESELPISLLPDGSCSPDPEELSDRDAFNCLEDNANSQDENSISMGGASTLSSPSQVLLYDSSSLEINYVKPKSFNNHNFSNSPVASRNGKEYDSTKTNSSIPKSAKQAKNLDSAISSDKKHNLQNDERKVLVTGSGNGTQLSLVRREGGAATLEIVITADGAGEKPKYTATPHKNGAVESGHYDTSQQTKTSGNKNRGSPAKRSKWGGLRRFGSKKDKEKSPRGISKDNSPAVERSRRKAENQAVENVKATSSSSQSFVSKLLSPKSKRSQKSSFPTSTSADFRYRSPNIISQMRPGIVRETASSLIETDCKIANGASPSNASGQRLPTRATRFGFTKKTKG